MDKDHRLPSRVNLRVGARLGNSFSVVLARRALGTAFGLRGIDKVYRRIAALDEENAIALPQSRSIARLLPRHRILVADMLIDRDAARIVERDAELRANIGKLEKIRGTLEQGDHGVGERKIIEESGPRWAPAIGACTAEGLPPARDAARAGQFERSVRIDTDKLGPMTAATRGPPNAFVGFQVRECRDDFAEAGNIRARLMASSLAATLPPGRPAGRYRDAGLADAFRPCRHAASAGFRPGAVRVDPPSCRAVPCSAHGRTGARAHGPAGSRVGAPAVCSSSRLGRRGGRRVRQDAVRRFATHAVTQSRHSSDIAGDPARPPRRPRWPAGRHCGRVGRASESRGWR